MELTKKEEISEQGVKIYSVGEITSYIRNLMLNDKTLQDIWIKGEISNFKHHNGKHMYFSLKDEDSIIECAMFQNVNQNLNFMPENGTKVIIRGQIDVYKPRGKYELIVSEIHLEGQGEMYLKFLQLKIRLEKEGLFKEDHKRPIPKYPKVIGIVTSLEGAVIHDITNIIKKRYPHVKIIVYPSFVQGDEAKHMITKGIETLNKLAIDVIVIARGGGSFEELWPFNEEVVARAIYTSKIPIVSAVGHESDFTIADFVADKRASTPSAAAEMIVPNKEDILISFKDMERNLYNRVKDILENRKQIINQIINRPLFKKPYILINESKQKLDEKTTQLKYKFTNKNEILKNQIKSANERLNALSPYSVLNRGYSITMRKDEIVSSIKNINEGDIISTIVKDGEIESKVKNKNERKNV